MKKIMFAAAACCLFAVAAFAQKSPDFSGTWNLEVGASKLGEGSRIESMTLTVTQTGKDIKIDTKTTRTPRREGEQGGMGGGRGAGRRGAFGMDDGLETYTLDGKETKIDQEGPNGPIPVVKKASIETGKLELSSARTLTLQMGEITMTRKESWTLSDEGKTLTVVRENVTPRNTISTTFVFRKK